MAIWNDISFLFLLCPMYMISNWVLTLVVCNEALWLRFIKFDKHFVTKKKGVNIITWRKQLCATLLKKKKCPNVCKFKLIHYLLQFLDKMIE
jgi:hypothetical protein